MPAWKHLRSSVLLVTMVLALGGCSSRPLIPYSTDTVPLMLVPAIETAEQDRRGRFREIFCAVLEARGDSVPDSRPCGKALTTLGNEPAGSGEPVNLAPSGRRLNMLFVPGIGWDCFSNWLGDRDAIPAYLRHFGYDMETLDIDGLSSSAYNAKQVRDAVMRMTDAGTQPKLVLVGYSKGIVDILEAIVQYPEIHPRIAAVVSMAGSVGGSPLAIGAQQSLLDLLQHFPGSECRPGTGDDEAVASLRPGVRKAWLARRSLPAGIRYYSLIAFPEPEQISSLLGITYRRLATVDPRNDGQIIFYDQFIPGSTLLGYVNADHWALAVPIARGHEIVGEILVDRNDYPREALYEALLRFIEEDMEEPAPSSAAN